MPWTCKAETIGVISPRCGCMLGIIAEASYLMFYECVWDFCVESESQHLSFSLTCWTSVTSGFLTQGLSPANSVLWWVGQEPWAGLGQSGCTLPYSHQGFRLLSCQRESHCEGTDWLEWKWHNILFFLHESHHRLDLSSPYLGLLCLVDIIHETIWVQVVDLVIIWWGRRRRGEGRLHTEGKKPGQDWLSRLAWPFKTFWEA